MLDKALRLAKTRRVSYEPKVDESTEPDKAIAEAILKPSGS